LEIFYLKSVDSTHTYIKNYLKQNSYTKPICFYTQNQTSGIGSRDNSWDGKEGNLFFSFAIDLNSLPQDIPIQSFSIYFSYILKLELEKLGSKVWLKWPNDFYIDKKKIGGTITSTNGNLLYCGIGLNLSFVSDQFGYLDIQPNIEKLLKQYFQSIKKEILWKHIFSKYLIEFEISKQFETTMDGTKVSLEGAVLEYDGSIYIKNKKVFSLR
jgi:BirA family biotin operon repressor/biotin-[acetyl-CoA-carboxylase] ligase